MVTRRLFSTRSALAAVIIASVSYCSPASLPQQPAGPLVRLRAASFDPLSAPPTLPRELRSTEPAPRRPGYYIVQSTGPIRPEWLRQLEAAGAKLLDYLPDFAFIARLTPDKAKAVAKLSGVRWVGLLQAGLKIKPGLLALKGSPVVRVCTFPGEDVHQVASRLAALGGRVLRLSDSKWGGTLRVELPVRVLPAVARINGVSWIEQWHPPQLFNDAARRIMSVSMNDIQLVVNGPCRLLFGTNQIVAVCDTGLDTGNVATLNADFGTPARLVAAHALGRPGRPGQPASWSDPDGHGTHICGSILGSGVNSGADPAHRRFEFSFAGVAPEARLVMQSVMDAGGGLEGIPNDLRELFQQAYDDGARIHNNSWGSSNHGEYDASCRQLDTFVWSHPDMVILCAAGNDGIDADWNGVIDSDSIGPPSTAKNCITVGASENLRPPGRAWGEYWSGAYPVNPIHDDPWSDNASGRDPASGRGPCDDGRLKPDICAPGTNIVSVRSHAAGAGTGWGEFNPPDKNYIHWGGTSKAAALAAGAAALVRQYYTDRKGHTPSAALVKATLCNGAFDMVPGQYGTGATQEMSARPNNVEGWGRIDLENSLVPEMACFDEAPGLKTGETRQHKYLNYPGGYPLHVTLAWSDFPGALASSTALVNDLDLTVTDPASVVHKGNDPSNTGLADRKNNLEGVDIASAAAGVYTVTVSAYNVPNGPQPYAVVISGLHPMRRTLVVRSDPYSAEAAIGAAPAAAAGTAAEYSRVLDHGASVTLAAPDSAGPWWAGGYWFMHWDLDGIAQASGQLTLSIAMDTDHIATAHYGRALNVRSEPIISAAIAGTPTEAGGSTNYSMRLADGTQVTLTAPDSAGGYWFMHWDLDGIAQASGQLTLSMTMEMDHIAAASYGHALSVRSAPITGIAVAGSPPEAGGTTNYNLRLAGRTDVTLTAPGSWDQYHFVLWDVDGKARPSGQLSLDLTTQGDHEATAHYAIQTTAYGSLSGRVIRGVKGPPVASAHVQVYNGTGLARTAFAGTNGAYVVAKLPPGTYTVTATAPGHMAVSVDGVSVYATQDTACELALIQYGTVAGRVVDAYGSSVAGAKVTAKLGATSASAAADVKGRYQITNLIPGDYVVTASAPKVGGGTVVQAKAAIVTTGAEAATDFALTGAVSDAATGSIGGMVTSATDGSPIASALAHIYQGTTLVATVDTALTGTYIVPARPAGTYQIKVSALGYLDVEATGINVAANSGTVRNFVLPALGSISGEVTSAGLPVAEARVVAYLGTTEAGQVASAEDGSYVLPLLQPGSYTIECEAFGHPVLEGAGVIVSAGADTELALALQ